jgi:hypothetical protein
MPHVERPVRGAIEAERREIKAPGDSGIVQERKKRETRKPPSDSRVSVHMAQCVRRLFIDPSLTP